ncbi:MAG: DUF559 domain-containing protein [Labilithrix sp.]|nr:DUF559 domain-containing protein [Labilithrix sp.]MCW5809770.1 DUF559 domain-containing protein [Labilithrix sp.]
MRFAPTRGEECLWRVLSGSKTGFAFRRQLVIANHIVDFACTKVRLAVEVDGGAHQGREPHDAQRDRELEALGWSVVRIPEQLLFSNLEEAVRRILARAMRAR